MTIINMVGGGGSDISSIDIPTFAYGYTFTLRPSSTSSTSSTPQGITGVNEPLKLRYVEDTKRGVVFVDVDTESTSPVIDSLSTANYSMYKYTTANVVKVDKLIEVLNNAGLSSCKGNISGYRTGIEIKDGVMKGSTKFVNTTSNYINSTYHTYGFQKTENSLTLTTSPGNAAQPSHFTNVFTYFRTGTTNPVSDVGVMLVPTSITITG